MNKKATRKVNNKSLNRIGISISNNITESNKNSEYRTESRTVTTEKKETSEIMALSLNQEYTSKMNS